MKVEQAGAYKQDYAGYSYMPIKVDGKPARIFLEQKAAGAGLLFLGPDWEGVVSAILPADPANGQLTEQQMDGFIDDPKAMELYNQFWEEINGAPRQ